MAHISVKWMAKDSDPLCVTVSGPTQTPVSQMQQWGAKPGLARLIRVLVGVLPVLLTFIATMLVSRYWIPAAQGWGRLGWWVLLTAIGVVVMTFLDRLFRRVAPLSTLLRISLVFPDEAPSRFAVALRSGNTKKLQRRIDTIRESGIALTEDESYASQMLELVALLSEHDRLTRGHCERVRAYTEMIIEEMGLSDEDASRLRWAALLHDLGKLMVPAEILNKDGRPTDEEWEILKTHPAEGAKLAAPISAWLGEWSAAISQHHERWDGGGYPNGLAGDDIHLGARIVAVADTYDVITSARSYKDPISAELARSEIARCSGSQFDPMVVRAFLSVGIGRLRFMAGPMAWLSGSVASAPASGVASIAATTVAGAVALVSTTAFVPVVPTDIAFSDSPGPQVVLETTTTEPDVPSIVSGRPAQSTTTAVVVSTDPASTSPDTTVTTQKSSTQPTTTPATVGQTTSTTPRATTVRTSPSTVPALLTTTTTAAIVVQDDSFTVSEGGSTLIDVLGNDSSQLSLLSASGGTHATALVVQDGKVRYTHNGGESAGDSFSYVVSHDDGRTASGSAVGTVLGVNDAPVVADQAITITAGASGEGSILQLQAVDPDDASHTWSLVGTSNASFTVVGDQLRLNDASSLIPGQSETVLVSAQDSMGASSPPATVTITVVSPSTAGLLISEFSSNGANSAGDFVEIYNASGQPRDLGGLRLQISSHTAVLSDNIMPSTVLPSGGFYLFKRSGSSVAGADQTFDGALPNVVGFELLTADGTRIDAVGTRAAPEVKSGAVNSPSLAREGEGLVMLDPSATSSNQSMGRRHANPGSCVDTNSNVADLVHNFAAGTVSPRGSASGTAVCGSAPAFAGTSGTLIISEVRTDGPGSGKNDFIEFFNPTGSAISLDGWQMGGSGGTYDFPNVTLAPGQHFLVGGTDYTGPVDDTTGNSPKNDGTVDLLNPGGETVDSITFATGATDLPVIARRMLQSYVRKYGCQFTGDDRNDFEHVFFSTPQTMSGAIQPCPG